MPGSEPLNEKDFASMLARVHATCGCDDCWDKVQADVEVLVTELRNTYALFGRPGLEVVEGPSASRTEHCAEKSQRVRADQVAAVRPDGFEDF